ncbi:hypothetical protein STTU_0769 [Streptomyces sp. Tu6071]|nr:hypothetical protein STTU_0769 [Streptomyces sp. Tu6071]
MLSPKDLSEWLGISLQAVYHLNHSGAGPRYSRVGGKVIRYRLADVEAWLDSRAVERGDRSGAAA